MNIPGDLGKYYQTISNTTLLEILENPGNYQPQAVAAAQKEFTHRQLSEVQINEARQPLLAAQLQKELQREKIRSIEDKVKQQGQTFIETINPIQTGVTTAEKTIRYIVILFSLLFFLHLIDNFRLNLLYIKGIFSYPVESLLFLLPLILIPPSVFMFWKKKKAGWICLSVYLTYSLIAAVRVLVYAVKWQPSGLPGLDRFFPAPSVLVVFISLVFFSGMLYVICRKNIRIVFSVSEDWMISTLVISSILSFLLIALYH